jgi:uncharacterized membrane protein
VEFSDVMEYVAQAFEAVGVAILVYGAFYALRQAHLDRVAGRPIYTAARSHLGRSLLLGLEVLVAADIVRTVAVESTLTNVAVLGALVLVRTVLSFSISTEIYGMVPWRRAEHNQRFGEPSP